MRRNGLATLLPSGMLVLCLAHASAADAALVVLGTFNPGLGELDSIGFDDSTDRVWVYNSSAANLFSYSRAGVFQTTIAQPGEAANDHDIAFAPELLAMAVPSIPIPANTMLTFNGESGVVDIYAVDKTTGAVLATLPTAFGASHVVGGAYHPGRDTFFAVQDRQPGSAALQSLIAEINSNTGAVLNSFKTDIILPGYTINWGDLEVHTGTGDLFVVSSDESSILELTPTGGFVRTLALPGGVGSLSGIALDEARGEIWVSGTGGQFWRLGGLEVVPEPSSLILAGLGLFGVFAACRRRVI